jgi:large subunit ribosomal protein L23
MNQQVFSKIIIAPIVSEKSTFLSEQNQKYAFKVKKTANKINIKKAVELMFKVEVESVHVMNVKGKSKRFGRFIGSRSDWKKAYVKLKEGFNIELAGA